MIDKKIYREKYEATVLELYGYSSDEFYQMHEHLQTFILAMAMQHLKIPMRDITPTRFGMSVYVRIVKSKIYARRLAVCRQNKR